MTALTDTPDEQPDGWTWADYTRAHREAVVRVADVLRRALSLGGRK